MKISIPSLFTPALALFLAGCATTQTPPIQKDPGFSPDQMDKVYVLPIIDDRVDTAVKINFKQAIRGIRYSLEDKRYPFEFVTDPNAVAGVSGDDLKTGNPEVLAKLGPPEARWVIVFTIEELSRRLTFGSTGNAEMTMTIVDRQSKRVVWRDKGVGQDGQGGLLGMAMIGAVDEAALDQATQQVIGKLPKHKRN